MTKKILIVIVAIFLVFTLSAFAKKGTSNGVGSGDHCRFIDEDGDGINDNFRDHDGDGIPNHQDPDWTRPEDGSGYKNRYGVNEDDGSYSKNRHRNGPRFGGNGFGSGICDGDGPFGLTNNNRNRHEKKGKD